MTEKLQIYKCDVCGNIVEMVQSGAGELVCCDQPMTLQVEQTADVTTEKHVPYIEKVEGGYKVRIGQNAAHPMEQKHYIQWIELLCGENTCRQFLKPGDTPEAFFACDESCCPSDSISAREYCNIHGLWKG
ncbi:MAG: desulfoferrodoxin [Planctomycetota bacterium]